jgi:hypothetical protein
MYEQRVAEPEPNPQAGATWRPDGVPFPDDAPDPVADRYVAIDRLDEDAATLIVAPWPVVDPETGRLAFLPDDARTVAVVDAGALRDRVDRDRGSDRDIREGQLARPVRVGDVFWVRGYHAEPGAWESVIDVTRAGRYAAKAAFLATASGAPLPEDAAGFGIAGATTLDPSPPAARPPTEETPQPPPGPVAFPAV